MEKDFSTNADERSQAKMFCKNCGKQMRDEAKFCPACGTQVTRNAKNSAPVPQVQPQVTQNTTPMPPVQPSPAQSQPQGAWQQAGPQMGQQGRPGSPQVPADNKKLVYGLGIAVAVLLLVGGGFAAYHFIGGKDTGGENASVATETGTNTTGVAEQKPSGEANAQAQTGPAAADPIRANIVSGISTVASQVDEYYLGKILPLLQGEWYDDNGAKAVTIKNRTINGCEIVGVYDLAGGGGNAAGTFRLKENGKEWDVRMSWNISRTPGDSISVNGSQTFHKSQEYYFESIAGVHLGMTPEQVKATIGQPSQVLNETNRVRAGGELFTDGWNYQDKGIIVGFGNGSVDKIILIKYSKLHLDKSGLNCYSSPEDFGKAYSMKRTPKWPSSDYNGPNPIGNGEYIFFGKDMEYIMLTIYDT